MQSVDILILGAGWTSEFLIPLLLEKNINFTATSRDGGPRSGQDTITFTFDPDSDDSTPFKKLPDAVTVLITFPIYRSGASEKLVRFWKSTHQGSKATFIQLGSTGIWNGDRTVLATDDSNPKCDPIWCDRHSPFDTSNERGRAEGELLALSPEVPVAVLDLCGLWGGKRNIRNWVGRVAPTKEALAKKGGVHMIHGIDVARAILAVHENLPAAVGQRWLVTDMRVYDWWELASAWGNGGAGSAVDNGDVSPTGPQPEWVKELMKEQNVRVLPRPPGSMGRVLDSREFWNVFGLSPLKARLE